MIHYTKKFYSLGLLFRLHGSAIPRALPWAIFAAANTFILQTFFHDYVHAAWASPFPYQSFSYIFGFIIVFRSNFGYDRYKQGRMVVADMTARWADACAQAISFDMDTLPDDIHLRPREEKAANVFRESMVHLVSLLHALALQHLRIDWDLHNLTSHSSTETPPPLDVYKIARASRWLPCWICPSLSLQTNALLRARYNRMMPIPVIGGLSVEEQSALGGPYLFGRQLTFTRGGGESRPSFSVYKGVPDVIRPQDIPNGNGAMHHVEAVTSVMSRGVYIPAAAERVNIVLGFVYRLYTRRRAAGGLNVDPPTVGHVYSLLADGMKAFESGRSLCENPFPFPWAQLVLLFLVLHTIMVPFMISAFINETWLSVVVTFMAVQTYWSMNEVARDLEDPFIYDPNELPLPRMQYCFNERLLQNAAAHFNLPESGAALGEVYVPQRTGEPLSQRRGHTVVHSSSTDPEAGATTSTLHQPLLG